MNTYCNGGKSQRIKITSEQASAYEAPCPKCGRVLRIVPNQRTMEATLASHVVTPKKRPTKGRNPAAKHHGPRGWCWTEAREPIENGAGEKIGEKCLGCGTPFALTRAA